MSSGLPPCEFTVTLYVGLLVTFTFFVLLTGAAAAVTVPMLRGVAAAAAAGVVRGTDGVITTGGTVARGGGTCTGGGVTLTNGDGAKLWGIIGLTIGMGGAATLTVGVGSVGAMPFAAA